MNKFHFLFHPNKNVSLFSKPVRAEEAQQGTNKVATNFGAVSKHKHRGNQINLVKSMLRDGALVDLLNYNIGDTPPQHERI